MGCGGSVLPPSPRAQSAQVGKLEEAGCEIITSPDEQPAAAVVEMSPPSGGDAETSPTSSQLPPVSQEEEASALLGELDNVVTAHEEDGMLCRYDTLMHVSYVKHILVFNIIDDCTMVQFRWAKRRMISPSDMRSLHTGPPRRSRAPPNPTQP